MKQALRSLAFAGVVVVGATWLLFFFAVVPHAVVHAGYRYIPEWARQMMPGGQER